MASLAIPELLASALDVRFGVGADDFTAFSEVNEKQVSSPGYARPLRVPMRGTRFFDIEA